MSTDTLPTKFDDLDQKELFRSALEDFALPVEKADNKKTLLAAFVEGGVTWDDYVAQHPGVAPEVEEVATPVSNEAVQADGLTTGRVRTAEVPEYDPTDVLLIKMERENPLFGFRQYVFTQENPYALMRPHDAEDIIRMEDGFRQALPSELDSFYAK